MAVINPNPIIHPPDTNYLNAAKGWCELRDYPAAAAELGKIGAQFHRCLDVLEVRWLIHMNTGQPGAALELAEAIKGLEPDRPLGWVYAGYSLRALNRLEDARQCFAEGARLFPDDYAFPYDLACLCCLLGRTLEARKWLRRALELGGNNLAFRALEDGDLELIRELQ